LTRDKARREREREEREREERERELEKREREREQRERKLEEKKKSVRAHKQRHCRSSWGTSKRTLKMVRLLERADAVAVVRVRGS
jgi:hypothetical protein